MAGAAAYACPADTASVSSFSRSKRRIHPSTSTRCLPRVSLLRSPLLTDRPTDRPLLIPPLVTTPAGGSLYFSRFPLVSRFFRLLFTCTDLPLFPLPCSLPSLLWRRLHVTDEPAPLDAAHFTRVKRHERRAVLAIPFKEPAVWCRIIKRVNARSGNDCCANPPLACTFTLLQSSQPRERERVRETFRINSLCVASKICFPNALFANPD